MCSLELVHPHPHSKKILLVAILTAPIPNGSPPISLQHQAKLGHHGSSPLHLAAESDSPGVVRALLRCNADPQLGDDQGDTALHCAVLYGSPKVGAGHGKFRVLKGKWSKSIECAVNLFCFRWGTRFFWVRWENYL